MEIATMVKMPRQVMRYSPAAGKHTLHTVERVKKRKASELKWGQRRFRRVTAGYRGFPRPKPADSKRSVDGTKRINLIYRCTETGKAHVPKGKRAKKFELVDK
ncbi:MAG: 50S ribosomal protein L44e [Candidatus Poseidoniales archaeon]|jgi:large subunit ribosomal protein L44e|nr:50S ribosomal protein L44e [Candidatus Poseidoniales archaeon]